jgi:EamA domain-containing membrane protein RarD
MKQNIIFSSLFGAAPLLLVLLTWILTIGSFNILDAVHSSVFLFFSGLFTLVALCTFAAEATRLSTEAADKTRKA